MSKIGDLPHGVVWRLCQHLNVQGSGVRNWKDLASQLPPDQKPYDLLAIQAITRNGLQPYTSPADQLITDLHVRGVSVDQLYLMLASMEAWQCMAILESYVSVAMVEEMKRKRKENQSLKWNRLPSPQHSSATPPADSPPSPEVHPVHGVLPSLPPPLPNDTSPTPLNAAPSTVFQQQKQQVATPPTHLDIPSPPHPQHYLSHHVSKTATGPPPHEVLPPVTSQRAETIPLHQPQARQYASSSDASVFMSGSSVDTYSDTSSSFSSKFRSSGQTSGQSSNTYSWDPSSDSSTPFQSSNFGSSSEPSSKVSMAENGTNILHFSYAELSEATGCFTEGMVGIGSFGTVFKARVRGNGPYAIKKLHTEAEMGLHCGHFYESFHRETFSQELQLLTRYHHRNILSLVAHSNDGYRPCLVYEYMENGSLAECLQKNRGVCLSWDLRVDIAKQVADALHFLHTVNKPTCLVHGDIKSANILLDVNFVPKLSDFGLAREVHSRHSKTTISTNSNIVMGTLAYMAPEFIRNKKLTTRTDVYAFGVVMLELYTGQPAFSDNPQDKYRVLTDRLSDLLEDSELHREEVLRSADPQAHWLTETALRLFDIITVCLQSKQRNRLPIKQVLDQLDILPQQ